MDFEKAKRRQSIKVIISEVIMFFTVIVTVVILAFVVSGYWINENFEVERQGMLQISSSPTGASINIDDESSWSQKTNTSKVLATGEHKVTLTKDGYDSWSKTINISEGLLYRLHYPRLFPLKRNISAVYDAIGASQVFLSDDREKLLIYSGDANGLDIDIFATGPTSDSEDLSLVMPEWTLIELKPRDLKPGPVTLRDLYDFFEEPSEVSNNDSAEDFELEDQLGGTEELIYSKFYDDRYLTVLDGAEVTLYKKGETAPVLESTLSFTPTDFHVGHEGEFIVFSASTEMATLDMEALAINEWRVEGSSFDWLDENMIYTVADNELIVYDFDGLNRRSIAQNVSNRFPATIVNNEWLYYFSDNNLIRESLRAS